MINQIFVNVPVRDLQRSIDFFGRLGFTFDPRFTDENATCMVMGENIYAMLLVESYFKTFTNKQICDTSREIEAIFALAVGSRSRVDEIVATAVAAGGKTPREPQDLGFMYQHAFEDPDGHLWEVFHMDMDAFEQVTGAQTADTSAGA